MKNNDFSRRCLLSIVGIFMTYLICTPTSAAQLENRMFHLLVDHCMNGKVLGPKAEEVSKVITRSCRALGSLRVHQLDEGANTINAVCYLRGDNSGFQVSMAGPAPGIVNRTYGYFCSVRAMVKRVNKNSKFVHLPNNEVIQNHVRKKIKTDTPSMKIEYEGGGTLWKLENGVEITFENQTSVVLTVRVYSPDPRITRP